MYTIDSQFSFPARIYLNLKKPLNSTGPVGILSINQIYTHFLLTFSTLNQFWKNLYVSKPYK